MTTPYEKRRADAAVAATKDFTTEGLEEIVRRDLSGRLALLASLMMEEIKAKEETEDTQEYPLTRGEP